jgi:membrane protein
VTDRLPEPQPERQEPVLEDPGLRDLSGRDWKAILVRAAKQAKDNHITDAAAALAYYSFLALPAVLLVALGVFSLAAGPETIRSMIDRLEGIVPAEAISLIEDSLTRLTENRGGGLAMVIVGFLLALWTAVGAMAALIRGLNRIYERGRRVAS